MAGQGRQGLGKAGWPSLGLELRVMKPVALPATMGVRYSTGMLPPAVVLPADGCTLGIGVNNQPYLVPCGSV